MPSNPSHDVPRNSSHRFVGADVLARAKADQVLNRIDDYALLEDDRSRDQHDFHLRDQEDTFGQASGYSDIFVDCENEPLTRAEQLPRTDLLAQIVDTGGSERVFTDAVPYMRTVADPLEEVTSSRFHHKPEHVRFLQIDVYEIGAIQRGPDGSLRDAAGVTMGGDKERNRSARVILYGVGAVHYDPVAFERLCRTVKELRQEQPEKDCLLVAVNLEEAPEGATADREFDSVLTMRWEESGAQAWPVCVRTVGYCFVMAQKTSAESVVGMMAARIYEQPGYADDEKIRETCDTAVRALTAGLGAIDAYDIRSSMGIHLAELAKWATVLGVSLVLETCGIPCHEEGLFSVVPVDADIRSVNQATKPRVMSISKGDGVPAMHSRVWNHMFPSSSLVGFSRSPMAVATSIFYGCVIFGNELGRLATPVENLFFYDYASESRSEGLNRWLSGVAQKVASSFAHLPPLDATGVLANVLSMEMIRCKARVEEAARRLGVVNHRMAVWTNTSVMLMYRLVDAEFNQLVPYTMWTADEMDALGFGGLIHDVYDFGYDVSVKESSNMFFTMTNGEISETSVRSAYVRMANGLQYVIERYRYDAAGLVTLATFFWNMTNGRHRVIPFLYNGACAYEHRYLDLDLGKGLVHAMENSDDLPSKPSLGKAEHGKVLRDAAESLGVDAIALAKVVTVDIENTYLDSDEISEADILKLEQRTCELVASCALGCDPANARMTEFLWMLLEHMCLKTGMYLSASLGSLNILQNRRQSDDRGGLGYAKWEREAAS